MTDQKRTANRWTSYDTLGTAGALMIAGGLATFHIGLAVIWLGGILLAFAIVATRQQRKTKRADK